MPLFCDVALPVPLDMAFTYAIPPGTEPVIGGRVLVPFRQQRLSGVVVELHDRAPQKSAKDVKIKKIVEVLDTTPVLNEQLLKLGKWIADYYLAPIGEVFRALLPLSAEFKRTIAYRITETGRMALHLASEAGSSGRSKRTPDEQMAEYRVLDYLAERESVREGSLRGATGASRALLAGMTRKKWITREDISAARDAARVVKVAVLVGAEATQQDGPEVRHRTNKSKKLNENQTALIEALAASGGCVPVDDLQHFDVPRSTLGTLVRRGVVHLIEEPKDFHVSKIKPRPSPFAFEFSAAQKLALTKINEAVAANQFSGMLLHGITGSGKTAVYLAAMRQVLESGRSSILLVPEIGLTPAVAADLHQVFGDEVAILHSGLTNDERAEQWHRIRRGDARVVAGTRSAVFAPVRDLALIIVDEEQDSSYKQEETPRYHARDVAVMRAKMAEAAVVLGSATPSLESYYNAKKHKYALVELPDRVEKRPLPEVEIVDMRQEFQETGQEQVISRKLAEEIRDRLEKKEQVMVLLNRRGYSPVVLCRACGKTLQCENCAVSMTHHKHERKMECHYCGHQAKIPQRCVHCGSEYVYFVGTGSEKLEELLHGMFPQARIGRLDRDTVRGREDFEHVLNALNEGALDMLVGTQMIAKGHDIHGVTLVGVIGADMALGLPDFRAAERTFQLLTQVAGRAGRGQTPGKVVLQTYFQDHYAVQFAARHDFAGFYEKELQFRTWMHYPPYSAVANVLIRSEKLDEALTWSGELGRWFEKTRHEGVRVLGPAAAPITRLKRDYRYHFILKSPSREKMNALLRAMLAQATAKKIPRTQVIVDVDAVWMM
jgi:primosomal protein N' (replication factor Y) (superfamily II helicase)